MPVAIIRMRSQTAQFPNHVMSIQRRTWPERVLSKKLLKAIEEPIVCLSCILHAFSVFWSGLFYSSQCLEGKQSYYLWIGHLIVHFVHSFVFLKSPLSRSTQFLEPVIEHLDPSLNLNSEFQYKQLVKSKSEDFC